jgi:hypothetical protein
MISIVLIVVVINYVLAIIATRGEIYTGAPSAQSAAVVEAVAALYADFNETGTLVFYPNNVGPVPYLFYQDSAGRTVAKALESPSLFLDNLSSWSGARIFVTGHLDNEHVVVTNIVYLSGP